MSNRFFRTRCRNGNGNPVECGNRRDSVARRSRPVRGLADVRNLRLVPRPPEFGAPDVVEGSGAAVEEPGSHPAFGLEVPGRLGGGEEFGVRRKSVSGCFEFPDRRVEDEILLASPSRAADFPNVAARVGKQPVRPARVRELGPGTGVDPEFEESRQDGIRDEIP